MVKFVLSILLVLLAIILQPAFSQNIEISHTGNPTEPSIMMDPNNPDILVAGSNLNYFYLSNNGGQSWSIHTLTSPYGVWGGPVIDVDTEGNFYFFHLSNPPSGNWIDRIICQKSTNNGSNWSDGTFTGLNGTKAQDKQWSVVDRSNNNIYLTWTQFDNYGSENPSDISIILFSKSVDGGDTWSTPKRINKVGGDCIDSDNTVEGAVPAVGPNGEIYVAWAGPNGIVFNRSMDQGETWLEEEILVDPMPGGWDYAIPSIYRANGLPVTKCDLSGGPNHGAIYINWSDQRNGEENTDIWLSKSVDGGDTWSSPIRVNDDDSDHHQFFSWMDIDQTNGNLYFVFYDRRNYSNSKTDVYLASSNDGGISFANWKISESPFLPNSGVFFGDYTNIVAHDNIVRPIWTRLNNGSLSIWTDITPLDNEEIVNGIRESKIEHNIEHYPNPASEMSYVSFKLHTLSKVSLYLYNEKGQVVQTILDNKEMSYGKYVLPVNLDEAGLKAGVYLFKLSINGQSETLRTFVID